MTIDAQQPEKERRAQLQTALERLHVLPLARKKHEAAPLAKERENFLAYRLSIGIKKRAVRTMAATLLHVIRILNLTETRFVTRAEVEAGASVWSDDVLFHGFRKAGPTSRRVFMTAALLFLQHNSLLAAEPPDQYFASEVGRYAQMLEEKRSLGCATLAGAKGHLSRFFRWLRDRRSVLRDIQAGDVLEYLTEKAQAGKEAYVGIVEGALRSFFIYAADQGWVDSRVPLSLQERRWVSNKLPPSGTLSWMQVRELIDAAEGDDLTDQRARAILLLCAVYGLRASEVARLTLHDLSWETMTISIRRSKSGIAQCMPLRFEVADALSTYINGGRPSCSGRSVFVTLQRPHRAMRPSSVGLVVRRRMVDLGGLSRRLGPHALRHACATQLLQSGSSLREVADFLGHRDLKSVSIYAQCDRQALVEVGAFSIKAVV